MKPGLCLGHRGPARVVRVLATLTTCALLAACSESGPLVTAPVGAEVDAVRITVQDAGRAGQVLTYADMGQTQQQEITIADGFNQELLRADAVQEKAPTEADVTRMRVPVTAEVVEPDNTESSTRSVSVSLGAGNIDNLEFADDIASVEGFRFGWFAQDSGQISSVNLAAPASSTDNGRALTERYLMKLIPLTVVFPKEPVGVGARWTVDARVVDDSTMLQTTTFQIRDIQGSRVSLDVEVSQRPALGAISTTIEGKDHNLSVLSSNTASQGSLVVDLDRPLPVEGAIQYTTRVVYGEDGSDLRVVQDTTTALNFR